MAKANEAGRVVERDGTRYLDIDAAAAYLGKRPSTIWLYVKRYSWATYRFPLHGKRTFLLQSDLDELRNAPPEVTRPKNNAA